MGNLPFMFPHHANSKLKLVVITSATKTYFCLQFSCMEVQFLGDRVESVATQPSIQQAVIYCQNILQVN